MRQNVVFIVKSRNGKNQRWTAHVTFLSLVTGVRLSSKKVVIWMSLCDDELKAAFPSKIILIFFGVHVGMLHLLCWIEPFR